MLYSRDLLDVDRGLSNLTSGGRGAIVGRFSRFFKFCGGDEVVHPLEAVILFTRGDLERQTSNCKTCLQIMSTVANTKAPTAKPVLRLCQEWQTPKCCSCFASDSTISYRTNPPPPPPPSSYIQIRNRLQFWTELLIICDLQGTKQSTSVYNNLPQTIHHSDSAPSFKAALKTHLFNNFKQVLKRG